MKFNEAFTLKDLAEAGYIMGLSTIGEVANHVECHYDAYWLISDLKKRSLELNILIDGHENDSIDLYLSEDDKNKMDDELEKAMAEKPSDLPLDIDFPTTGDDSKL